MTAVTFYDGETATEAESGSALQLTAMAEIELDIRLAKMKLCSDAVSWGELGTFTLLADSCSRRA